jgi:hypothetical protein
MPNVPFFKSLKYISDNAYEELDFPTVGEKRCVD